MANLDNRHLRSIYHRMAGCQERLELAADWGLPMTRSQATRILLDRTNTGKCVALGYL